MEKEKEEVLAKPNHVHSPRHTTVSWRYCQSGGLLALCLDHGTMGSGTAVFVLGEEEEYGN